MTNPTKTKNKILSYILTFTLLSAACIVFEVLCLFNTRVAWLVRFRTLCLCLSLGITLVAYFLSLFFVIKQKELVVKSFLSVYVFLLFVLIVLFVLQKSGFFNVVKDSDAFRTYMERSGGWMPLVYILFQYLQVIVLPVPSVVSTVAGVALFGALKATLYSLIGILLGSFTAFFIGRKLGNKAVIWLVGKESLEKWQKKLKGKDNLILTLMFLLPLFPDDILCFIAGLSSMTTKYFTVMILISRIIAVSATCYSIDFIPFDTAWGIAVWCLLAVAIVVAFVAIYKNMDKLDRWMSTRFKCFRKNKHTKENKDE